MRLMEHERKCCKRFEPSGRMTKEGDIEKVTLE